MAFRGTAHKFGAHVDTDQIIPARYLNMSDPQELAAHVMEDADATFAGRVQAGDIVVADVNFGCGSSREHAPISIKAAGVSCIVAKSFARIFFRNSINLGLPVVECPEAVEATDEGDTLQVDLSAGTVTNMTKERSFTAKPYEPFMLELLDAGGLVEYTKRRLQAASR